MEYQNKEDWYDVERDTRKLQYHIRLESVMATLPRPGVIDDSEQVAEAEDHEDDDEEADFFPR